MAKDPKTLSEHAKNQRAWYHRNYKEANYKRWVNNLRSSFNMTPEQYNAMLVSQNDRCAICPATEPGGRAKRFHVDHDHVTGKVRGLLCSACNLAIGMMKDSPEILRKAATYLEVPNV